MTSPRVTRLSLVARLASRMAGDPGGDAESAAHLAPAVHAARGPGEPVDDLVAAHADAVYRYALRLTRDAERAADLAQDALLRGWQARRQVREPAAMRVWLLRIATNLHRDGLRRDRPDLPLVGQETADRHPCGERRLEELENVRRALEALDDLPPRQRQVMHLVTIEQLSHEEAAGVLGITTTALKANLSVARRRMREKLKDVYDDLRGVRSEN